MDESVCAMVRGVRSAMMVRVFLSMLCAFPTAIALAGLALGSRDVLAYNDKDFEELRLGRYVLRVPESNAVSSSSPSWFRWIPGLDSDERSALIRFWSEEVTTAVPSYRTADRRFQDDIEVLLIVLNPEEVRRYHDPQFAQLEELWYGRGSYKNRIIEFDQSYGLYKVYRKVEYPRSWAYLNRKPDPKAGVPKQTSDFWVANCLLLGPKEEKIASCRSYGLLGNIVLEFNISDYNIPVLEEVRSFLIESVQSWIVKE